MNTIKKNLCLLCFLLLFVTAVGESYAEPAEQDVIAAMRKASEFMVNEVSLNGGYLWSYSADLTRGWGEAMARPSQIEVHQTGTPSMGELFLEVYKATGDTFYLRSAEKAADALVWGQHPTGGWHYFIDFDMSGIEEWYETVASKFLYGMEEYRHFYGNCSFDDGATQQPTLFLLNLYMTTLDPKYREPLLKALDFFLESQFPNGAWPQRYPLKYDFVHDGLADYTSYYTFNDGGMSSNINVLMKAWEQLGDEKYLEAARRGMDFYLVAQGPIEQAGWAEQYTHDMQPAWARTHEPKAYASHTTRRCINDLMNFYRMTGDRRYLRPIPYALDWLEKSTIKVLDDGRSQIALYYEVGTNKPMYKHITGEFNEEGYGLYKWDNDPTDENYGLSTVDLGALRKRFDEINALSPEEAVAGYEVRRKARPAPPNVDPDKVVELIKALDSRGAWVEEIRVYGNTDNDPAYPWANTKIQGISVNSFIRNMRLLNNYLKSR